MTKRLNKPLPKAYEGFFKAQECSCTSDKKEPDARSLDRKKAKSKNALSLNIPLISLVLLFLLRND